MTGSFNPLPDEDWEKNVYAGPAKKEEAVACPVCQSTFESSNQLYKHQREQGHTKNSAAKCIFMIFSTIFDSF